MPFLEYGQQFDRKPPIDFEGVRSVALSSIIAASVPLKRDGREFKACCPFHNEKSPSFYVNDDKGFYHCFGCSAHGDAVDFLMRAHGVDAREAAAMVLGGSMPSVQHRPVKLDRDVEPDRGEEARAIWTQTAPADGTPVASYLAARALDGTIPDALRFARLRYGTRGELHPCMVALVVDAGGNPQGIQRTYLNAAGTWKLDVPKPKLSLGRVKGGAVRLAASDGEVIVTEGIEDALSLYRGSGIAAWAAAGAGMLPGMNLPGSILSVTIGADADAAGEDNARKAAERFTAEGRAVRIMRPMPPHKDFNSEIMGALA